MNALITNPHTVSDHQISLYYFIGSKAATLEYKMSYLAELGLPDRITQGLANTKNSAKNIWEQSPVKVSRDFLATIQNLFSTAGDEPIIESYTLNHIALKSINGQQLFYEKQHAELAKNPARLSLSFGKQAIERLKQQNISNTQVDIKLQEVTVYVFKTGFKVAVINCQVLYPDDLPLALLTESVYKLAKLNALSWQEAEGQVDCKTKTSMGELVRKLVGDEDIYNKASRVYTDTYVQFHHPIEETELKNCLLKLARHYTDDYQINIDREQNLFIQDFSNVTHCIAPEGCATAISLNENSSEFLRDYKNKVRKSVYIPMQLLSFHESNAIQHYTSQTTLWLSHTFSDKETLARLQHHQLAMQNFSLNFQQPIISKISIHNEIYAALRKTHHIDEQLHKAQVDNATICEMITSYHAQKSRIRYCRLSKYGVSAVAFLTAFTLSKEIIAVLVKQPWIMGGCPEVIKCLQDKPGIINLSLATIVMLAVFYVERKHCQEDAAIDSSNTTKQLAKGLLLKRRLRKD